MKRAPALCMIGKGTLLTLRVAQWFGLYTFMLEVSSSKSFVSESKRLALWVELVAPSLPSAGYLSYVVCESLHRSGSLPCAHPKGNGCRFSLLSKGEKKIKEEHWYCLTIVKNVK